MRVLHNNLIFYSKATVKRYPGLRSAVQDLWEQYCSDRIVFFWKLKKRHKHNPDPMKILLERLRFLIDKHKEETWKSGEQAESTETGEQK